MRPRLDPLDAPIDVFNAMRDEAEMLNADAFPDRKTVVIEMGEIKRLIRRARKAGIAPLVSQKPTSRA